MSDEMPFLLSLVRLMAILFFPLYPSLFVMNRLPKTKAEANGPLSGMKIKLAGGGAFYFILLLVCWQVIPVPPDAQARAWTVQGSIALQPLNDGDPPPEALKTVTFVCLPTFQDYGQGNFVLTVARQTINGVAQWPALQFSADKYQTATIPTGDNQLVDVDVSQSKITVKKPILLIPLPTPKDVKTVTAVAVPQ
jgi:hypothetical protein